MVTQVSANRYELTKGALVRWGFPEGQPDAVWSRSPLETFISYTESMTKLYGKPLRVGAAWVSWGNGAFVELDWPAEVIA